MKNYLALAMLLLVGAALADAPSISLDYQAIPGSVNPGGSAQIIISIGNLDTVTDIEDLNIILISRGGGVMVTSGRADLGTLPASSSSSAAFAVRAQESAKPGTYVVEASGSYKYDDPMDNVEKSGSFKLNVPIVVSYRSSLEIMAGDAQITPGATEDLEVTLTNAGRSTIRDLIVTITPYVTVSDVMGGLSSTGTQPKPMLVYPIGNLRKSVEVLPAGESAVTSFTIRASDIATAGLQSLGITVTYTDAAGTTQEDSTTLGVTIVEPGTELVVDNVVSELQPGKPGSVRVGIKNIGEANLVDLYISIMSEGVLGLSGSNERLVESLAEGETKVVEFEFEVDSAAEAKPVEATLEIAYQREGSKVTISESKTLGLTVRGSVDLQVVDKDVDLEDAEMEIDIANYGNKDAEAVKIDVLQDGNVFGTGFTDSIKPNKHKVFRFDMPEKTDIVVRASYKDYDAPEGKVTVEIPVTLSKEEITPPPQDPTPAIVGGAVFVVLVIWYLRKRSKNKKQIDISKYK